MFEDGTKIDDILNVLRRPTLDDDDKKTLRVSDTAIRYESQKSVGDDNIRFDFVKNFGGLL